MARKILFSGNAPSDPFLEIRGTYSPTEDTMVSRVEEIVSRSFRHILANMPNGASIPDSDQFQDVLTSLEGFLPLVLGEIYPEWKQEGLDGILPVLARKTGENEGEIFGACIVISDQTVTPLHVRLQVGATKDEVCWLECRPGDRGTQGMVKRHTHPWTK